MSEHVCTPETCPDGADYFVSAIDADRTFYMAGPYPSHPRALEDVSKALEIANRHDGRAWFMSWGTVKLQANSGKMGSLTRAGLL